MGYVQIEKDGTVAVVWLDQPEAKVNTISLAALDEFRAAMESLAQDAGVSSIVLISRKEDTFIAGADLTMLRSVQKPGEAEELSRRGNLLLSRAARFPKPIVAAIHGATLGGGLEVALACTYRLASDDPKTILASPEVKLGLLPAGGGTQRLPRLIGLQKALDLLLTGKNIYAAKARKIGLVDHLVHPPGLLETAKAIARELARAPLRRKDKRSFSEKLLESTFLGRWIIYRQARKMVQQQTWGHYPAPFRIIECVKRGLTWGMEKGLDTEAKYFDELALSPQSKALVSLFFAMTATKKNPYADRVRPLSRIGILGAGLMGAGIAQLCAEKESGVLLKDIDFAALGRGEKSIWRDLSQKVEKKILTSFQRDVVFSRIVSTTEYGKFSKADLVIEAVFEDLAIKRRVLAETEAAISEQCIFASNTSCIPISDIAAQARHPERILGMHYFSPVSMMPLLEIVVTPKTADWAVATAVELGTRQGKTVIVVNDGPGFYTTRILAPLLNEALCLIEEGCRVEEIDRAMMQFGFPVGPITLIDEVGIDVANHVSCILGQHFAHRGARPSESLEKLFQAGYRGRKNQQGFYRYQGKSARGKKPVNNAIYAFFGHPRRKPLDTKTLQHRVALMLVNEAVHCLGDGILHSPTDGDLGAILGLGFPPFLGGPFRYLDRVGTQSIVEILRELEKRFGPRFAPAPLLLEHAASKKLFHPT